MGASQSSGWWMKVINEVIRHLEGVDAYLDDVVVYNGTPEEHVRSMREFFERLRRHKLKLSPPKSTIGTTHSNFLGHTITPSGTTPDAVKAAALSALPMPTNVKSLRSFCGGLTNYRAYLKCLSKRLTPATQLLKKDVPFAFTSDMEKSYASSSLNFPLRPSLFFLIGKPSKTARARSAYTATQVWTALAPHSNRNNLTALFVLWCTSAAAHSTPNATGQLSIWKQAPSSGPSNDSEVTCAARTSKSGRVTTAGEPKQTGRAQPSCTTLARIFDSVPVHPQAPHGSVQRRRRHALPSPCACH